MKFNYSLHNPKFEFSNKWEKDEVNEYKKELLQDLHNHLETEYWEIQDLTENIYYSEILIEVLEREKLNTKLNLAFNSFFYEEKCFYVDENRTACINEDENLFNHFYHVFAEKDKNKATAIASGIIRVSLIDFICQTIVNGEYERMLFPPKYNKRPFPDHIFKDFDDYQHFLFRLNEYKKNQKNKINKKFVSALFYVSRTNCTQLEFAEYWNKNHGDPKITVYKDEKGNFKARFAPVDDNDTYVKIINELEKI